MYVHDHMTFDMNYFLSLFLDTKQSKKKKQRNMEKRDKFKLLETGWNGEALGMVSHSLPGFMNHIPNI